MRMKNPILLILIGLMTLNVGSASIAISQETGKLTGNVMDVNGAAIVIPRPEITVENVETRAVTKIEPDSNGDYQTELPIGIYRIGVNVTNFYPFRRAVFSISPGKTIMINVVPALRYLVRGTTVSTKEPVDKIAPKPIYDSFSIPQSRSGLLNMLIRFDKKRTVGDTIEYQNAVLSYDALTIYADKLRFRRKMLRARAVGTNVVVENDGQRVQVKSAELDFKAGRPIVKLERRVPSS
jgi:Carboxypeptidase regulatory-like domain